jgi:transposase
MEAYSPDLRARICAACDERVETRQEVADRFSVSRWFVHKLLRQRRVDGTIAAKPRGHGPAAAIGLADQQRLRTLVSANADATLSELCRLLHGAGGARVNIWTMCRTLKTLRLVLKKRPCMPASGTRRAYVHCAGTSRSGWRHWTPRRWSLWMRAASTPQ